MLCRKFKQNEENIHKLIALSAALNYQLREAEETRNCQIAQVTSSFLPTHKTMLHEAKNNNFTYLDRDKIEIHEP